MDAREAPHVEDHDALEADAEPAAVSSASVNPPSIPKIARIVVDRETCIGATSCVVVAPDVFEMDSENIAIVKNPVGADDATILAAAESCPVQAIFLYDVDGKQIYP